MNNHFTFLNWNVVTKRRRSLTSNFISADGDGWIFLSKARLQFRLAECEKYYERNVIMILESKSLRQRRYSHETKLPSYLGLLEKNRLSPHKN